MAALAPELPPRLAALETLALDLRWTWSHEADALWQEVDPKAWLRTRNPWTILRNLDPARLEALAADRDFLDRLDRVAAGRQAYLESTSWFSRAHRARALEGVAYFSMEFGLSDALPLYAGGLGILAGDLLKTASDLGAPVIGVGLLYGQGYFRQSIDAVGWQHESYPYNEPATMPIRPAEAEGDGWLKIPVELPGRTLVVRVWQATVGRTKLYLLDSNDPLNGPTDRAITARLYEERSETRLLQEIVLGVAGWRAVARLHPEIELCHVNEGHAAFAALERARGLARKERIGFWDAWAAARAGTLFTTHTAVASGFDRYPDDLIARYLGVLTPDGLPPVEEILSLGRNHADEEFNMAYLAARGSYTAFGVSRVHERVSRRIFAPLFPRWPEHEIPIGHITNAVHVPSWDSAAADKIWTAACGKDRWRGMPDDLGGLIASLSDEQIWAMRGQSRQELVETVRVRLAAQLMGRGLEPEIVAKAESVLDPNVLTLGFARRFTGYKRPNLLLHDNARFARFLANETRPAQIVLAGKAHPADLEGKAQIREWIGFAEQPGFRHRVVFLEDYDIALAQELVTGVDLWVNTPARPWEACGTSGMKVLANGGLNLSELDGWWAEAYTPEAGWAIGNGSDLGGAEQDAVDAERLYAILETEVAPAFYERDAGGIPRVWLKRIRKSMALLAPQYCSARMVREYLRTAWFPAAAAWRERIANGGAAAKEIAAWEGRVSRAWSQMHIGAPTAARDGNSLVFTAPVYLGEMDAADVRVELYADPRANGGSEITELARGSPIAGAANGFLYAGRVGADRPPEDYTVRIVPHHPGVQVPWELPLILWQK